MKKFLSLLAFTAILTTTVFVACKKQINVPNSAKNLNVNHKINARIDEIDDAANSENPYDEIGYWHNYGLQATRAIWLNKQSTPQDISNSMQNYLISMGINDQMINVSTIINSNLMIKQDFENSELNYVNQTSLSPLAKDFMKQLLNTVINASNNTTYLDFKNKIILLENNISNSNLNDEEKKICLQTTSVARYSMLYWLNEIGGMNSNNPHPVTCRLKLPKWLVVVIHIVVSDIGGGVLGGGIPGAAVASAVAAVYEILP